MTTTAAPGEALDPAGHKDVAELLARYPRAGRLVALIKKVEDVKAREDLLSALAAFGADVLSRREVAANGPAADDGAAAANGNARSAAAFATPGSNNNPANANAANADAEAAAAFERSLAVLDGVTLQAPRSGKADLGFGAECLRIRTAKGGPMLTVPYADIEHVIVELWLLLLIGLVGDDGMAPSLSSHLVLARLPSLSPPPPPPRKHPQHPKQIMDKIPQQPDDRNGVMLALRRGASIAGGPPAPASAAAAAAAPPDAIVLQTRTAPLRIQAPEVARHLGEWLEGPAAVVVCQLLGCLLRDVGETTFLAADVEQGFKSSRGLAAVSANIRANGGWLFPLPCGLAYLGKPACFLRLGDIEHVEYGRAAQGSSTFDLLMRVDDGGKASGSASPPARSVELAQIDTSELPKLQAYFQQHKALVGALRKQRALQQQPPPQQGDWGSAVAPKAKAAMPAAGAAGKGGAAADEDDDDSDDDDEDFDPEDEGGASDGGRGAAAGTRKGKKRGGGGGGSQKKPQDDDEEEEDEEGAKAGPSSGKRARAAAAYAEEEEDIGSEDSSDEEEEHEDDEDEDDEDEDEELVATEDMSD
jgi:hypothetical protein